MKTSFTFVLFLFATVLYAQSSEDAAIKQVLVSETTAYRNRDCEVWAAHWGKSREISFLVTNMGLHSNSCECVSTTMKDDMESNSTPMKAILETSDFDISVTGKQAFVVCFQPMKSDVQDYKSYEIRSLRKVKGQWKLAAMVSTAIETE